MLDSAAKGKSLENGYIKPNSRPRQWQGQKELKLIFHYQNPYK